MPGLTIDQLQQIYRGQITNWRQVGGPDLIITPFSQRPEDAELIFSTQSVLPNQPFGSNVQYPTCVVKHLLPVSKHPESVQTQRGLFTREAEALKKLGDYDKVPQLLAHFEENQEFYLVQEFIEGHPLSEELLPGRGWTDTQVVQLLIEVLSILVFVHCHGLIHRNIKPTNLVRRQQDNRLVLIDFGSSAKLVWTQLVTAQGKTNATFAIGIPATMAIGTPGYMPIEQEQGRPRPNSDIYALGMIGIQALTGLSPTQLLQDSDTGELLWQHHANVCDELAGVLNKMVRKSTHFLSR